MAKNKDEEREHRIVYEVIVDAYDISPEDIVNVKTTEENLEILNDWLYWHNFELLD